jgi:hypothetical protein
MSIVESAQQPLHRARRYPPVLTPRTDSDGPAIPLLQWQDHSGPTVTPLTLGTSDWRAPEFLLQAVRPLDRLTPTTVGRTTRTPGISPLVPLLSRGDAPVT